MKICKLIDEQLATFSMVDTITRVLKLKKRILRFFLVSMHVYFIFMYLLIFLSYFPINDYQAALMDITKELGAFCILAFHM